MDLLVTLMPEGRLLRGSCGRRRMNVGHDCLVSFSRQTLPGRSLAHSLHFARVRIFSQSMKLTAIFLLLLAFSVPSCAWGPEGHRVVADVAWNHLSPLAKRRAAELLGDDSLAEISTWADEVRNQRSETYGWHFVDIPRGAGGFSESRDCYKPDDRHPYSLQDHHNCVVDRIQMFSEVLANSHASQSERKEALKFLVHFVGDIHQPLHALEDARGGNDIHINLFGSNKCGTHDCNLHAVWDISLIEHTGRSEKDYAAHLEKLIALRHLERDSGGSSADWANESFHLGERVWVNDGGSVDESYFQKNIEALDRQLALAALRLAALLNNDLGR